MKITKYGHACLLIEEGDAHILIDPGAFSKGFEELTNVDAVLVTHQHMDHLVPDNLKALLAKNPSAKLYVDEDSAKHLADHDGPAANTVHAGDVLDVAGVTVKVVGEDHAVIHESMPGTSNVGYLVGEKFFYPGDSYTLPGAPVEVLGLPTGGPWMKVSEAIDYVLAVKPKIAIPVHDAVLAMPSMNSDMVNRVAGPAGIEIRVVENGASTEL